MNSPGDTSLLAYYHPKYGYNAEWARPDSRQFLIEGDYVFIHGQG